MGGGLAAPSRFLSHKVSAGPGAPRHTAESDVYSLGVVLWEIATQRDVRDLQARLALTTVTSSKQPPTADAARRRGGDHGHAARPKKNRRSASWRHHGPAEEAPDTSPPPLPLLCPAPRFMQARLAAGESVGLPEDIPPGVRSVIRDCLHYRLERRPSAVEVVRRLREAEAAPASCAAS